MRLALGSTYLVEASLRGWTVFRDPTGLMLCTQGTLPPDKRLWYYLLVLELLDTFSAKTKCYTLLRGYLFSVMD